MQVATKRGIPAKVDVKDSSSEDESSDEVSVASFYFLSGRYFASLLSSHCMVASRSVPLKQLQLRRNHLCLPPRMAQQRKESSPLIQTHQMIAILMKMR